MSQRRRRFVVACVGGSAGHCGLLMIPCMLFIGAAVALGVTLAFNPMPILLPAFLGLFVALTAYNLLRGYRACSACGEGLKHDWKVCPRCGDV